MRRRAQTSRTQFTLLAGSHAAGGARHDFDLFRRNGAHFHVTPSYSKERLRLANIITLVAVAMVAVVVVGIIAFVIYLAVAELIRRK